MDLENSISLCKGISRINRRGMFRSRSCGILSRDQYPRDKIPHDLERNIPDHVVFYRVGIDHVFDADVDSL